MRRRAARITAALVAAPIVLPSPLVSAESETTCARDVLVATSMQRQAIDQLESADGDDAARCRVWRRHIDTMRRLAGVYGRCLSGSERKERLDQVQGSEAEFRDLVKGRCKGL